MISMLRWTVVKGQYVVTGPLEELIPGGLVRVPVAGRDASTTRVLLDTIVVDLGNGQGWARQSARGSGRLVQGAYGQRVGGHCRY